MTIEALLSEASSKGYVVSIFQSWEKPDSGVWQCNLYLKGQPRTMSESYCAVGLEMALRGAINRANDPRYGLLAKQQEIGYEKDPQPNR